MIRYVALILLVGMLTGCNTENSNNVNLPTTSNEKISTLIIWDSPHYAGNEEKFKLHIRLSLDGTYSGTYDTVMIVWLEDTETKVRHEEVRTMPQSISGRYTIEGKRIDLSGKWPLGLRIKNISEDKYNITLKPAQPDAPADAVMPLR